MASNYLVRNKEFPEGVIVNNVNSINSIPLVGGVEFLSKGGDVEAFFSYPCSYFTHSEDDSEEVDA